MDQSSNSAGQHREIDEGVHIVSHLELRVNAPSWPWAVANRDEILAHFERRKQTHPGYFNGRTFILASHALSGDTFKASYAPADFASYLYWREKDFPDHSVRDGFGSAILRSAEGHILLGQQAKGNVNAGFAYLPGGFIDQKDIQPDGRIDIDGSVRREIGEETGLDPATLTRVPGYRLSRGGLLISFGVEYRASLSSDALRAKILDHLAREAKPELADIVVVRKVRDLEGIKAPDYTRHAVRSLLED